MGISYYFSPQLSIRSSYTHKTITADDALSPYDSHRARSLHFRSRLDEVNFVFVYEFFQNQKLASKYFSKVGKFFSPYIFVGGGLFHFNPQARDNEQWVDLQPLGTERQFITSSSGNEPPVKKPQSYGLWNISIPFGGGIKFNCSKIISISFEAGL